MNDLRLHKSPNGATVFHLYACRGKEEAHGDRDDGGYFTHNVKVHLTEKITVGTLIEKVRDGVQRKVGDTQTPGMHLYGPVNLNHTARLGAKRGYDQLRDNLDQVQTT